MTCDPPYKSIGIRNGLACYSDTLIGSIAVYYCFECGLATIKGLSTTTCSPNGSWTGDIPQCSCKGLSSFYQKESNESETPNFATYSKATTTNTDDYTKTKDRVKSTFPTQLTFILGISITLGALLVCIIVIIMLTCSLTALHLSKRKLNRDLIDLQETLNPIYEDIELNTTMNTAYHTT